jgi:hypothetical protein
MRICGILNPLDPAASPGDTMQLEVVPDREDVMMDDDDDDDEGDWPAEYKERFFEAIEKHGDSWPEVAAEMGDQSVDQVLALARTLQGFMGTDVVDV